MNSSVKSIKRFRFWAIRAISNDEIWDLSHFHHVFFCSLSKVTVFTICNGFVNIWRWSCFLNVEYFFHSFSMRHKFLTLNISFFFFSKKYCFLCEFPFLVVKKRYFISWISQSQAWNAKHGSWLVFFVIVVLLSESLFIEIAHLLCECVMNQ